MARVLFVEDDKDLTTAVEMALEAQNFIVEVVHDGKSALDRLTFEHYDVAIVDWMLPQMSGYEVCQEYRRNGGQTPILLFDWAIGRDAPGAGSRHRCRRLFDQAVCLCRIDVACTCAAEALSQIREPGDQSRAFGT